MLNFSKYQGAGNDFAVVDARTWQTALSQDEVRRICDRHVGIGADGVLALWNHSSGDFEMKVQNADGTDAGMCGNGMRCILRFLYDQKIVQDSCHHLNLVVSGETYRATRIDGDTYQVVMGCALTEHPTLAPQAQSGHLLSVSIEDAANGPRSFRGRCHFFGNPHFTIFGQEDPMELATAFGAKLSCHAAFADRVNVGFVRQIASGFETVVFERGVGITQACGSGACAVGVSALREELGVTGKWSAVHLPGGTLDILVDERFEVTMRGPAQHVFDGQWGRL